MFSCCKTEDESPTLYIKIYHDYEDIDIENIEVIDEYVHFTIYKNVTEERIVITTQTETFSIMIESTNKEATIDLVTQYINKYMLSIQKDKHILLTNFGIKPIISKDNYFSISNHSNFKFALRFMLSIDNLYKIGKKPALSWEDTMTNYLKYCYKNVSELFQPVRLERYNIEKHNLWMTHDDVVINNVPFYENERDV